MEVVTTWMRENLLITIAIGLLIVFLIIRSIKHMHFYMSSARYARKARRLRKKKYNGVFLVDKLKKRRKKHTNNFKKLKRKGKKLTKKYLEYKAEELPILTKYIHSKVLKASRRELLIVAMHGTKTKKKYKLKKGAKQFINIIDTYDCLDQFLVFLHELPDAMASDMDLNFYLEADDVTISYMFK